MIDHISIGVANLEEAAVFYESLLDGIGLRKLVEKPGTVGFGKNYPEFWLNHRPGRKPTDDEGFHVCLRAGSTDAVAAFHATAVALGASSEGEPGARPEYSDAYYAAFILDKDGNRIEVVTFIQK